MTLNSPYPLPNSAMPLYYNKTDRPDCAILRGFITDKDSFYLDVSSAIVVKNEDVEGTYYFLALCNKFEGLINIDDKTWKFSPCAVISTLHDKPFIRRVKNKETGQYEEKEEKPAVSELAFLDYVSKTFSFNVGFQGEVEFSDSRIALEYLKDGSHPKIDRLFDLSHDSELKLSSDVINFLLNAIKPKSAQANYRSSYTQKTIKQIYEERLEVLLAAVSPYGMGCTDPISLSFGLKNLKTDDPEAFELTMQIIALLLK